MSEVFNSIIYFDHDHGFWWKLSFFTGLVSAPNFVTWIWGTSVPIGDWTFEVFDSKTEVIASKSIYGYIVAGFLVGFGTRMGNGCTTGHVFCKVPLLNLRSLVATVCFIASGMGMTTLRPEVAFLDDGPSISDDT